MKIIILAAGRTDSGNYGFPANSKPKCLFHFKGEILLERQVKMLRAAGLNDITIVVGYQEELIEQFNKVKNLGLKLVYNPTGASDVKPAWRKGLDSVRAGIQGVDDDVLIIPGDVYLTVNGLKMVLADNRSVLGAGGHGFQLFKLRRNVLPQIRKSDKLGLGYPLLDFIKADNGVTIQTDIIDVDWYNQTDEGKHNLP